VFDALSIAFSKVYSKRFRKAEQTSIGIVLGEHYFFRVNSDVALLIILREASPGKTEVEVISCAGGTGVLGISYSAHSAYIQDVRKFLEDSGFETEFEKEIPYFGNHLEGQ
jgi:hypothetical protein